MRLSLVLIIAATATSVRGQTVEWPAWGGDLAATKYSTLTDINRDNVARLTKAWEWATGETPKTDPRSRPGSFQATPLMIGDTLFAFGAIVLGWFVLGLVTGHSYDRSGTVEGALYARAGPR